MSSAPGGYVSAWKDDEVLALGELADKFTSELFFEGVRVPAGNLLGGTEGQGFAQLMTQLAQERLVIADSAVAGLEVREYLIARMYADARVQKIYGGSNEIMKDLVARSLR